MAFTKKQTQAIESRNSNLLVSAAAGSGKTTVLVERIIRRVLDKDDPVDIDRILVMTFTKAAAGQMRDKITKAIEAKRAVDPSDRNLIKQAALVHNASITTIHGFCLDVIRNHFQEIGLDPDFRVADEGECRLLKQDILSGVIEEAYEEAENGFITMTECLATGKSDSALEGIIDKLYEFSMSDPDPDAWFDRCLSAYEPADDEEPAWLGVILDNAAIVVKDACEKAEAALKLCNEPGGPYMYADALEKDAEMLEVLKECRGYDDYRNGFGTLSFTKLGRASKNGPAVDPVLQERVKKLRDGYKAAAATLINGAFLHSFEDNNARIRACAPLVKELVSLARRYSEAYGKAKRDKKIVDFNDLEHLCIRILAAPDGSTAREYREYFREIYVDEYQDSSLTQEELLKYIAGDRNLFMVGDVKQSIYSFRLARPQLFIDKYERYKNEDEGNMRIDLQHNFRSRRSVIRSVNELFSQIMTPELGGIVYDDAASLHAGLEYPEMPEETDKTEFILIEKEKGINDRDLEAKVIASRIRKLVREHTLTVFEEGQPVGTRPVHYSDIVILIRTAKGWDERLRRTLSDEGIPVHVMSRTGYFGAREVAVLLDYLTVLDNPLQDIPMAAVLKSVFGRFTDEDLAVLKSSYPGKYLYDSLKECEKKGDAGICYKASAFLKEYEMMRIKTGYTPVYDLLLEIVDGEYGSIVSAGHGGKRRRANLEMLLKKAEDYGKTSYRGLFRFVKYIEMLKKFEVDFGEANITDENDDAVRIMTIHKSKGLEFPVCFIAGMHKKYNTMDAAAPIISDIDLGLGAELIDPVRRLRSKTILKQALAWKKYNEILAEEERILYVAMTRAKEKLIMTGVVNDIEKAMAEDKGVIKCSSHMELVLHGLNNEGLQSVNVNTVRASDMIESEIKETVSLEERRTELLTLFDSYPEREDDVKDDFADMITGRFIFEYPYADEKDTFKKVSVSELKRRSMNEENGDKELPPQTEEMFDEPATLSSPVVPEFIREQEKEIPATLHGTAVHRIFEIWDYENGTTKEDIRKFFEHIKREGLMAEDLVENVSVSEVSDFVNSDLAARMGRAYRAGMLYREQPFIFSMDGMLVQGIIDAYFIENGSIIIVDYKTDRTDSIEELAERYHVQLEYYARALSAMLDRPAAELIIYSTRHKNTVNIPWPVVH